MPEMAEDFEAAPRDRAEMPFIFPCSRESRNGDGIVVNSAHRHRVYVYLCCPDGLKAMVKRYSGARVMLFKSIA